jgi:hypothetical protein
MGPTTPVERGLWATTPKKGRCPLLPEVRGELAAVAAETVALYSNLRLSYGKLFE